MPEGFKFAIDRGGTFTDVWCQHPNGAVEVFKLLSEDPMNYDDAPYEAIRRIISKHTGQFSGKKDKVNGDLIHWIRMGTTVATNALLERKGEQFALLITEHFPDLLYIGNQSRPDLFDLKVQMPQLLYSQVVEVRERIILDKQMSYPQFGDVVQGINGEDMRVLTPLDEADTRQKLQNLLDCGIENVAVVLAHSYAYPQHEIAIGRWAKEMGFKQISLSHEIVPMIKMVPRGHTACVDAYLTPSIQRYIRSFVNNFKPAPKKLLFMQSDGGLTSVENFCGSRAILSGPAGGVIGYAFTTFDRLTQKPVIGFDMGGTSTDVSRYAGSLEHLFECAMGPGSIASVQSPQLDVNTVAAGGGSILQYQGHCLCVGPQSAGAHPGPAAYRKGGRMATVTDANVVLGRIQPQHFPRIFGQNENEMLDKQAAIAVMEELMQQINADRRESGGANEYNLLEVAMGFIDVANETMCRPIRALTQAKGYDTSQHVLACFGGAGAQHACGIARKLGMDTVFVHKYAGILSAYGLALADVVAEVQEPCFLEYNADNLVAIDNTIGQLEQQCKQKLLEQEFSESSIDTEVFLHLRYDGTDNAIMCSVRDLNHHQDNSQQRAPSLCCSAFGDFELVFELRYKHEFGFILSQRSIIVDDIRVRGTAKSGIALERRPLSMESSGSAGDLKIPVLETAKVFFDRDECETSIYAIECIPQRQPIRGPAIIIDKNSTIVVEPNCTAERISEDDLKITILKTEYTSVGTALDPIQLSIFSHRFMSTAEQMGRILQRTSISTNIKERLDFSCAVFGPDGGLVANAPHIPVHLGAMQHAVQYQMANSTLEEGDVLLSNHPVTGGSHLPDLTVITPVFYRDIPKPVFFVANRGHHADIGGTTPGSMPPHSKSIFEEGAVFKSFYLVKKGEFQLEALENALFAPAQYPNCSGTRNLADNISDLKAQIAANRKGIHLICELIDAYGLDVVQAYMGHIQDSAENCVRSMLKFMARSLSSCELHSADCMDDGTDIRLRVSIDPQKGSAVFDFAGTSPQVLGNTNCPPAVTRSSLLYCLRCLVGLVLENDSSGSSGSLSTSLPLNQGCLRPVDLRLPQGSLLWPDEEAAVVGGNVLTSQRIVDVILRAFGVCAASQGCMNNVTFGREGMGYYETVAGGAGAGPNWHGRSGVHTHMTNTRITDLEIFERRYPVILERFSLRPGSGGAGEYRGGDGVIREINFREPLTLSILSERRTLAPYGLKGGECGQRGLNLLKRNSGVHQANSPVIQLGAKVTVNVSAGDIFHLETPGGGGYGVATNEGEISQNCPDRQQPGNQTFVAKGSLFLYTQLQHST